MKLIAEIFKYFVGFLAVVCTIGVLVGVVGVFSDPFGLGLIVIVASFGALLFLGPTAILLVIMGDIRQLLNRTERDASLNSRELLREETPYSSSSRNEPNILLIAVFGAIILVGAGLGASYYFIKEPSSLDFIKGSSLFSKKSDPSEEIEAIIERKKQEADALRLKRNTQ